MRQQQVLPLFMQFDYVWKIKGTSTFPNHFAEGNYASTSQKFQNLLGVHGALEEDSPFNVLGIESSATDVEIKTAYRELTLKNHPDKLIAEGMPEEFILQANDKMASINNAYNELKRIRNLAWPSERRGFF